MQMPGDARRWRDGGAALVAATATLSQFAFNVSIRQRSGAKEAENNANNTAAGCNGNFQGCRMRRAGRNISATRADCHIKQQ